MSLVVSLATRGRPKLLEESVRVLLDKATRSDTRIVVSLDTDDWGSLDALRGLDDQRVIRSVEMRPDTIAAKWNRALAFPANVYLAWADDVIVTTHGFDQRIVDAAARFPDGIGVVYGPLINASFPGIQAPTRGLINQLGYMYPEKFPYWFVDHWIDDIARLIGRISYADVDLLEKRPGTLEFREPAFWATYFDAHRLTRRNIARSIIAKLDDPEWRKECLLAGHQLVEYRSKWINDNVRAIAPASEAHMGAGAADERYLRLKRAALKELPDLIAALEADENHLSQAA